MPGCLNRRRLDRTAHVVRVMQDNPVATAPDLEIHRIVEVVIDELARAQLRLPPPGLDHRGRRYGRALIPQRRGEDRVGPRTLGRLG